MHVSQYNKEFTNVFEDDNDHDGTFNVS